MAHKNQHLGRIFNFSYSSHVTDIPTWTYRYVRAQPWTRVAVDEDLLMEFRIVNSAAFPTNYMNYSWINLIKFIINNTTGLIINFFFNELLIPIKL